MIDIHQRLRSQGVDRRGCRIPARRPLGEREGRGAGAHPGGGERATEGLAAFGALLRDYDDEYARLKAERSGADFADLELRALALRRAPGPVADAWRERFTHLMVDEFQDTNRLQLELIDALRGPDTRLFTVGDEFQSIYRFRHAELEVFREQRAAAADGCGDR